MKKKYLCIGSKIMANDGDVHYISAHRLAELYKVNPEECVFARQYRIGSYDRNLILLQPRSDGNYELPKD